MRILFLPHSFNSLAQRLYLELTALGHQLSIEFDISDAVSIEAVALFRPALVIAPLLKRAIPEAIWSATPCLVVHPGIVGDRGPSALDWAIIDSEREWGVTVLQAERELDAGAVWATESFAMRDATKSGLYRDEVTAAASRAVAAAVRRFAEVGRPAAVDAASRRGRWRPLMQQTDRRIDWQRDDTATVLRKIRAADGSPGVLDSLFGVPCRLFDAHAELQATPHPPGEPIARRDQALLRATIDGAVWIGQVRRADETASFKLPAALAFAAEARTLPDSSLPIDAPAGASGWREIRYEAEGGVGCLRFDFYNGAMSTAQCERLTAAVRFALAQPAPVLMLLGGSDFWSNGIHLNVIEAADSPADESWRNIVAIDELTRTLIDATDRLVVAAMRGNAAAGGVFMALAADQVWARRGVVLNPHYKNMGNLYGSEYWTYLLPRRLRSADPADVMNRRLPISAEQAAQIGLVDAVFGDTAAGFVAEARERAAALATGGDIAALLRAKRQRRADDEANKPLAAYRDEELARLRRNFYGFDTSYHIARSNFVRRLPASRTPLHLAVHRSRPTGRVSEPRPDMDQGSGRF